jgi:hypothetical protein
LAGDAAPPTRCSGADVSIPSNPPTHGAHRRQATASSPGEEVFEQTDQVVRAILELTNASG